MNVFLFFCCSVVFQFNNPINVLICSILMISQGLHEICTHDVLIRSFGFTLRVRLVRMMYKKVVHIEFQNNNH